MGTSSVLVCPCGEKNLDGVDSPLPMDGVAAGNCARIFASLTSQLVEGEERQARVQHHYYELLLSPALSGAHQVYQRGRQ